MNLLKKIFSPACMVPEDQKLGDIPTARQGYGTVINLAWPSVMESVLGALVGFVDTLMVSGLGDLAISAVGITNQPKLILLAVFLALNVGVTAVVARRRGQNDREGAAKALSMSVTIIILTATLIAVAGAVFAEPFLRFAGAKESYIGDSVAYFRIIMISIPFLSVYNCINAAQRGAGNTKITLRTNLVANVVNVTFNYLLIHGNLGFPALGVRGAAIATLLGVLAAFCMSLASVLPKKNFLHPKLAYFFRFEGRTVSSVFKVGGSAMLEQLCIRVGFFLFAKMVATLGEAEFAAHQIGLNVCAISFTFGEGLSVAASALVGQSLGRERPDLAKMYGNICQRISLFVAAVLVSIFAFCARPIVSLFSESADVIAFGMLAIRILAVMSPGQLTATIFAGSLRGAGDAKYVGFVSMICIGFTRTITAFVLCYIVRLGLAGAWIAMTMDMYLRSILYVKRFSGTAWQNTKL